MTPTSFTNDQNTARRVILGYTYASAIKTASKKKLFLYYYIGNYNIGNIYEIWLAESSLFRK